MYTIVIEALTPVHRTSSIKFYKNNARSGPVCKGEGEGEVACKVKLRFSAQSTAIAEVERT